MRTKKRLFTKCQAARVSQFQALVNWHNTISNGMDTSPAQHLFSRHDHHSAKT